MGSGKTTLGIKLASVLTMPFVDLDAYIETEEKQSIADIFEHRGEAVFRKLETKHLESLINEDRPTVISLGGGTICFEGNLERVKQNGTLVYLDVPVSVLADRLVRAKKVRPLFKGLTAAELPKKIKELLEQRLVYYQQAHVVASGLSLTPTHLQQQILEQTKK
jgi:shikimate kinase